MRWINNLHPEVYDRDMYFNFVLAGNRQQIVPVKARSFRQAVLGIMRMIASPKIRSITWGTYNSRIKDFTVEEVTRTTTLQYVAANMQHVRYRYWRGDYHQHTPRHAGYIHFDYATGRDALEAMYSFCRKHSYNYEILKIQAMPDDFSIYTAYAYPSW